MPDILTITLNPALDIATSVDRVVAGSKLYCKTPRVDPGGGGVNVARTIRRLGGHATALVTIGGAVGEQLLALLAAEDVPTRAINMDGETRQSMAITDEMTGEQYRFGVPGTPIGQGGADRLISEISKAISKEAYVVLSGSLLPGLGDDFPSQIQQTIAPQTDRLIVDMSGAPLARLISQPTAPLLLLRVDHQEAEQVSERPLGTIADSADFASRLVTRGVARMVAMGRGAEGSVIVTQTGRFFCRAPAVTVRSKIGAGDSFVGAITLALSRGEPPEQALRWGVATASATVETEGTALCKLSAVERLLERCDVVPV